MKTMPAWMVSVLSIVAVAAGLVWWMYSATAPSTITTTPAVSTATSPLSSTIVDDLKQKTIYGSVPLQDASPYDRTDPFVAK